MEGYTYKVSDALSKDTTILFHCDQGYCKKIKGYIVADNDESADTLYSNDSGEWVEVEADNQACAAAGNVGNILMEATPKIQYCKGASDPVAITDGVYFYLSGAVYKVLLGNDDTSSTAIGRIEMKDGYYLLDGNALATTTGDTLVQCTKNVCKAKDPEVGFYPNAAGGEMIACTSDGHDITCELDDTEGYYIDNDKGLLSCDGSGSCVSLDRVGYFLNKGDETTNIYIKCTAIECIAVPAPTEACDSDTLVGKLTLDDKNNADTADDEDVLCLSNGIKSVTFADSSFAMVKFSTGSVFKYYVNKSTYYGLMEIKASSISLLFDNAVSVYCVVKETLVATGAACAPEQITATTHENYICNVDGVCIPATSTETLPESLREVKKEEESVVVDTSSEINTSCQVLTGKNCKSLSINIQFKIRH